MGGFAGMRRAFRVGSVGLVLLATAALSGPASVALADASESQNTQAESPTGYTETFEYRFQEHLSAAGAAAQDRNATEIDASAPTVDPKDPKSYDYLRVFAREQAREFHTQLADVLNYGAEVHQEERGGSYRRTPPMLQLREIEFAQEISIDIIDLIGELIKYADLKREHFIAILGQEEGQREFRSLIDQDKIKVDVEGIGNARLNTVNGHRVVMVKSYKADITFTVYPQDAVSPLNNHRRQYESRQLTEALGNPQEHKTRKGEAYTYYPHGRDSVSLQVGPSITPGPVPLFSGVEMEARPGYRGPIANVRDHVVHYMRSKVEIPKLKTILYQGLFFGPLQFGIAEGISFAGAALKDKAVSHHAAFTSLIFGTVIGSFNSTYRNILYAGGKYSYFMKSLALSLAFNYIFRTWEAGDFFNLSSLHLNTHFWIWINGMLNNYARTIWGVVPKMDALARRSTWEVQIGNYKTGIKYSSVQGQVYYIGQFAFKLIGIIPGMELVGNAIYLLSTEVMKRYNVWRAEKISFTGRPGQMDSAREMREKMENSLTGRMIRPIERAIDERFETNSFRRARCASYFGPAT